MFPSLEKRVTELEKTVDAILEELYQIKNQRVEQDRVEIDGVVESSDNDYEEADNDRDSPTSTTSSSDNNDEKNTKPEASKIQIRVYNDSASTSSSDDSS